MQTKKLTSRQLKCFKAVVLNRVTWVPTAEIILFGENLCCREELGKKIRVLGRIWEKSCCAVSISGGVSECGLVYESQKRKK